MYSGTNGFVPRYIKASSNSFWGFSFHFVPRLTQSLSRNCAPSSYFYSLPHSVTVTNVAFLFVPNGLKETLRHWECGSRREAYRVAEERGRERTLMLGEDGTGSIILRSAYVCLCVTEHRRGCLMVCVCVCVSLYMCVCAGEGKGGIRGEARDEENERAA